MRDKLNIGICIVVILILCTLGIMIKNYNTVYNWDERNDYLCMEDERWIETNYYTC